MWRHNFVVHFIITLVSWSKVGIRPSGASHFRGGTISWKQTDNPLEVRQMVDFRKQNIVDFFIYYRDLLNKMLYLSPNIIVFWILNI